jgi:hypothetical protein
VLELTAGAETIEETIARLLEPGVSPKQLLKAVQENHPKASRKDVVHAAFAMMIDVVDTDPGRALILQRFGIEERVG